MQGISLMNLCQMQEMLSLRMSDAKPGGDTTILEQIYRSLELLHALVNTGSLEEMRQQR